jgi:carboxynorspermidine decarboxylase
LQSRHGLDVYIEPGAALVRKAGYLVTTVIDLFRVEGKSIAVLDTTVNHVPEVFEYQFEPDVLGHDDAGAHEYRLAGSSCLAGDLMGDYAFRRPLRIGSRVVLTNVGAYAMVKSHMFNGINLPTIYSVTRAGEIVLRRRFTYEDFVSRFGVCRDAAV